MQSQGCTLNTLTPYIDYYARKAFRLQLALRQLPRDCMLHGNPRAQVALEAAGDESKSIAAQRDAERANARSYCGSRERVEPSTGNQSDDGE
jgi:hypothetical protein